MNGSEDHPFETGTTSVCPESIIGFFSFPFFDFRVENRFTLFFSSSYVLKDSAPKEFNI